ncbi:MAG: CRISPR-associated protein Csx20 [Desulfobia sp.]
MPNLLVIFNHTITPSQKTDARQTLKAEEIIQPPEELCRLWAQVPPEADSLGDYLEPLKYWLDSQAGNGDYVLIQGEFGATYLMVRFALARGLVPLYSTTRREAEEEVLGDGTVQVRHRFFHVRFRYFGQ